jgi:hypothetical protein
LLRELTIEESFLFRELIVEESLLGGNAFFKSLSCSVRMQGARFQKNICIFADQDISCLGNSQLKNLSWLENALLKNLSCLGNSLLKNLSWPLKTKKRERSGSGGSWDLDKKKKSQQRKLGGEYH